MLYDLLREWGTLIVAGLFGSGGIITILVSRRQTAATATPSIPAEAPAPTDDPVVVNAWLLSELGDAKRRLDDHDRVMEELPPYVMWLEDGKPPPPRTLTDHVRMILGLKP